MSKEAQARASSALAESRKHEREAERSARLAEAKGMPLLSTNTVVSYLHWVAERLVSGAMKPELATLLMKAVELVISNKHAQAQGASDTAETATTGENTPQA